MRPAGGAAGEGRWPERGAGPSPRSLTAIPRPSGPSPLSALRAGRGDPALGGALWALGGRSRRVSSRTGVSLQRALARRWGWVQPTQTLGDEPWARRGVGREGGRRRQTYRPRTGGLLLPDLRSPRGRVAPAAPRAVGPQGSGRNAGKLGLWLTTELTPQPGAPRAAGDVGRGVAGRPPRRRGRGCARRDWPLLDAGPVTMPHALPAPPGVPTAAPPGSRGLGAPASRARKQRGMRATWG